MCQQNKTKVKQAIRQMVQKHAPERLNDVNAKLIEQSMIFMEGFESGINFYAVEPVNKAEKDDLVLKQGVQYAINKLNIKQE